MCLTNKPVEFKTKIFHEGKVYLKVSDVSKALGYSKQQDFISKYSQLIEKISGIRCIRETDYNKLLSDNEFALSKQGQIEVTKIETLRSKINSVMSFQPLKMLLARDYLQMMTARTGSKSVEDYILTHEIPEEKKKALAELMQNKESNSSYHNMIKYLQDKEQFDIEKVRSFGFGMQYLTSVDYCTGKVRIEPFVVGRGVFHNITNFGDYELWNDMYTDDNGDIILPWCNYDYQEEKLINLSKVDIDRDFSQYNAIENMIWCIGNLKVGVLEDYENSVFSMYEETIKFDMPIELLVKLLKPDAVDTIYIARVIDLDVELYITEINSEKVFKEDFSD